MLIHDSHSFSHSVSGVRLFAIFSCRATFLKQTPQEAWRHLSGFWLITAGFSRTAFWKPFAAAILCQFEYRRSQSSHPLYAGYGSKTRIDWSDEYGTDLRTWDDFDGKLMVYTFTEANCPNCRALDFHRARAWEQAKFRKSHREGMEELLFPTDSDKSIRDSYTFKLPGGH